MNKIAQLTVGGLVATALTLGAGDVALAAPVTTATTTAPSSPSTSSPSTSVPSTKTAPPKLLTGGEIWRIVEPHHRIVCSSATKELARIHKAETAAATRLARAEGRRKTAETNVSPKATRRDKKAAGVVRGFQRLEADGASLSKKIDAKCEAGGPTS